MKRNILLLSALFIGIISAYAQPERVALGLSFATQNDFYQGHSGNPGFMAKTWISVDPRKTMYIIPSVTAFNKLSFPHTVFRSDTYMFQADIDFQRLIFHEKTLKIVAQAGFNGTYLMQHNYSPDGFVLDVTLDTTNLSFGPNLGAALEMRMGPQWDFIVGAKYSFCGLRLGDSAVDEPFLVAPMGKFVIQVHAVYYFISRGKGYSKR